MTARVLFVDDEPNILQGLRRMLRGMRNDWDMAFANGGAEALDMLAAERCDAIVTDMRMPGMDGAELLNQAAERYPATIRFILSGEADREMTCRTIGVSHRFLPKPCDADVLVEALRQSLALKAGIAAPEFQDTVTALKSLPTPGDVATQFAAMFTNGGASLERVTDLIGADVAMSSRVLQLANSAYFGIGGAVSAPSKAVQLMGIETLGTLVKDHDLLAALADDGLAETYRRTLRESLCVAQGAQAIAIQQGLDETEVECAYTAGLLHLAGRLILCAQMPERYLEVIEAASRENISLGEAETQVLGISQAAMGAYFACLWGLPRPIVSAIAHQAMPQQANGEDSPVLLPVHVAAGVSHGLGRGEAVAGLSGHLDTAYLTGAGVQNELREWVEQCADVWSKTEAGP